MYSKEHDGVSILWSAQVLSKYDVSTVVSPINHRREPVFDEQASFIRLPKNFRGKSPAAQKASNYDLGPSLGFLGFYTLCLA